MDRGILYFLHNHKEKFSKVEGHYNLGIQSVNSAKKFGFKTILFTNIDDVPNEVFDEVVYYKGSNDKWVYKYECLLQSPFEITLHLDMDTYIALNIDDLFMLMDRYDLAIPVNPMSITSKFHEEVPPAFPYLGCGLMLYKLNDRVISLYNTTKELLENRTSGSDERHIRIALYRDDNIRFTMVPYEYDTVVTNHGSVLRPIRIFHGKIEKMYKIAKIFAEDDARKFITGKIVYVCDRHGFIVKGIDYR